MLWRYDPRYKSYSQKTPAQICYQRDIYETPVTLESGNEEYVLINEIENHYQKRETLYADVWKKIGNCFSDTNSQDPLLSVKEKDILTEFVANLLVRNPVMIKMAETDVISKQSVNMVMVQKIKEELNENIKPDEESLMKAAYKYEWLDERINSSYFQIIKKLLLSFHCVFCASNDRHFITSNMPVMVKTQRNGDIAMLMVPLSPNCLLTYNCVRFAKDIIALPSFAVDEINKVYASGRISYVEYLFGKSREDIEHYYKEG